MQEIRHIGRLFRIATHALEHELSKGHERFGLTSTQGYVMGYLIRRQMTDGGPLFAKDIERHFDIRHSTVSGILQRLEAKGFLREEANDTDKRCKRLVLTEKALCLHEQISEQIYATEQKIFSGMTPDEIDTFVRLLRQSAVNLGADPDSPFRPEKEVSQS